MSKFEVPVIRVREVLEHPNADRLSIVKIGDYNCISAKLDDGSPRYKAGDLVVYVPEGALVPEWLLRMGFWDETKGHGMLAGKNHDRVKAIKLRGIVSQGIMYPVTNGAQYTFPLGNSDLDETEWAGVDEGDNMAMLLGITKYEPPIPTSMSGEVSAAHGFTLAYDIENIKRYPDILQDGEEVEFTEKTHGTFCQIGFLPDCTGFPEDALFRMKGFEGEGWFVCSKGLGGQGLVFKNNVKNFGNVYVQAITDLLQTYLKPIRDELRGPWPFFVLGEVYGQGVQDLQYGRGGKAFAAFDLYVGQPGQGRYLNGDEFDQLMTRSGMHRVPVLYRGPFNKAVLTEHTSGPTVIGKGANIREGVVIRPVRERRHDEIGRVILKSVSDDYLFRKGEQTEFN